MNKYEQIIKNQSFEQIILMAPHGTKDAIEKIVGRGKISEFIREAIEEKLKV